MGMGGWLCCLGPLAKLGLDGEQGNEGKRGISNITLNQRKQIGKGLAMGRGGAKNGTALQVDVAGTLDPCSTTVPSLSLSGA